MPDCGVNFYVTKAMVYIPYQGPGSYAPWWGGLGGNAPRIIRSCLVDSTAQVTERNEALRRLLAERGLDYYFVPSADEHLNEYLSAPFQRRQAITGFTGSLGDALVGREKVHLFVDSRYHLQAGREMNPQLVTVHPLGQVGVADMPQWLTEQARHKKVRVGYDAMTCPVRQLTRLEEGLAKGNTILVAIEGNLVDKVWHDRPQAPLSTVYALDLALTGETVADKLARVRQLMVEAGAGGLVLTRLDEVAWLTNLRGADIPHNPVFVAYVVVETGENDSAVCYTDNPIPEVVRQGLAAQVTFRPYGEFAEAVRTLSNRLAWRRGGATAVPSRMWLEAGGTTQGVRLLARAANLLENGPNPVARLKAIKNPVEINCSAQVHLLAGAAKVRAFMHLERAVAAHAQGGGLLPSEAGFAEDLASQYRAIPGFTDFSFGTIAAHGSNAAVVHYATPSPQVPLTPGAMLMVDSGVQVAGATTDDTRTVAVGTCSPLHKKRYTLVLRAHIRLAMQVFVQGTTGISLDALARTVLWNEGLDYGHGTGHGVGAFLNVHEGPQNLNSCGTYPLEAGMILSIEPGYYLADWGGIRLENLYVVEEPLGHPPHPAGKGWLRFNPLTRIPFDRNLIESALLQPEERQWLNGYHQRVAQDLTPLLDKAEQDWLAKACAEV